ncbi:MAG: hypothetical protein PHF00_01890 [Elusimicrobia bacterium]|nr:hypothetical protein [Elusimicrobiota bacterium]
MHLYCVDGSNVVRMLWGYGGPEFRRQEEDDCATLVEGFAVLCRAWAGCMEAEVFFDGGARRWPRPVAGTDNLRVRFSSEEPADVLILDRVRARAFSGGGGATVVTGDGELGRRCRQEGGRWLRVASAGGLEAILRRIESRFSRRGA